MPVKLDVDYEVTLQGDQFLVTLWFINDGEEMIVLESPATWDGVFPRPPVPRGTAAELHCNLSFLLGGRKMINAKDYPNDEMVIPPGQRREARFIAMPKDKGTKASALSVGSWP